MDSLTIQNIPERRLPNMIVAFAGWGDAAEAPTRALRFLNRTLRTEKVAEIDPEEFYDFTSTRPRTLMNDQEERYVGWPRNSFRAHVPDDDSPGLDSGWSDTGEEIHDWTDSDGDTIADED